MKIREKRLSARTGGLGLAVRCVMKLTGFGRRGSGLGNNSKLWMVRGMNNREFVIAAAFSAIALSVALGAGGCEKELPPPEPRLEPIQHTDAAEYLKDTIGEKALVSSLEWTPVRGYGLVYGLANTGSTVHPPGLRERMVKELSQYPEVKNAESILSDPSTAIVQVTGLIPPGTQRGERFDLEVRVADGTEATSLEGGILKWAELRRIDQSRGSSNMGMVLGRGEGPIFISPFTARQASSSGGGESGSGEQDVRRTDPRIGRILGGGQLTADEPRTYQLTLMEPSARVADQMVRQINARFADTARGKSDLKSVAVRVPAEYADEKEHFLRIVTSIYLVESPDIRERRKRLLVDQLRTGPDYQSAVYGLLAFGKSTTALIEPLLGSNYSDDTRYYAAYALARLGQVQSAKTLREFMLREGSPYQSQAAAALAVLPGGAGVNYLESAFDVEKPSVRIAAYQALVRVVPDRLPRQVWRRRMELGHVESKGTPFIFISRRHVPRVVIFGDVKLRPPVLVETPQFLVTARPHDRMVTVMSKRLGAAAAVQSPMQLDTVISALMLEEFGLTYSDVVAFLDQARRQEALTAPLVLEPLLSEEQLQSMVNRAGSGGGGESTAPAIVPGMRQPIQDQQEP